MRRRSAGRPGGQRSGSTRERLGSSDLALWRARAHLERSRVLQFAVYSCNAAHEVTQLAHPRTTSAGQSVVAARPDFGGFGCGTGCCRHTGTLLSRASTRQLTRAHICKLSRHKLQRWASLRPSAATVLSKQPKLY